MAISSPSSRATSTPDRSTLPMCVNPSEQPPAGRSMNGKSRCIGPSRRGSRWRMNRYRLVGWPGTLSKQLADPKTLSRCTDRLTILYLRVPIMPRARRPSPPELGFMLMNDPRHDARRRDRQRESPPAAPIVQDRHVRPRRSQFAADHAPGGDTRGPAETANRHHHREIRAEPPAIEKPARRRRSEVATRIGVSSAVSQRGTTKNSYTSTLLKADRSALKFRALEGRCGIADVTRRHVPMCSRVGVSPNGS